MWEDPVGPTLALQSALPTVALPALRLLAEFCIAFAIILAGVAAGVIATLGREWRGSSA
jgi:hypothetical protein